MKVVFFGTANVALPVLESLAKNNEVAAVVTSPDAPVGRKQTLSESPVSVLAGELNLTVHKPEKVRGNAEFLEKLKQIAADIFVVVAYGKILPAEIINLPPLKTVNVHFSLLPKYRGPSPIQFALLSGDTETGTSIFVLDEQVDHGPILAQSKIEIDADDNFISLSEKLAVRSAKLLEETLPAYAQGQIVFQEQDHSQASQTKIITKEQGKVDWGRFSSEIYNQFRAFYPWPGIWATWQGKKLKILDCWPVPPVTASGVPGEILEGGVVACGQNTALQLGVLQLEGKNETGIKEFLNGYPHFIRGKLE